MVLPRSLATVNGGSSTTGVRGWHGCSGIGWVCGVRERHNAPAGMLGRSRGPLGPPMALATAAACFSHGGGLVHVAKSPRPAIDDSVYAAVLQTSWRCCDYVLVWRGSRAREWWCTVRRRHHECGVHAWVHHRAPVGRSWRGRGCPRGCVCS